jgi:hypothetical protein
MDFKERIMALEFDAYDRAELAREAEEAHASGNTLAAENCVYRAECFAEDYARSKRPPPAPVFCSVQASIDALEAELVAACEAIREEVYEDQTWFAIRAEMHAAILAKHGAHHGEKRAWEVRTRGGTFGFHDGHDNAHWKGQSTDYRSETEDDVGKRLDGLEPEWAGWLVRIAGIGPRRVPPALAQWRKRGKHPEWRVTINDVCRHPGPRPWRKEAQQ